MKKKLTLLLSLLALGTYAQDCNNVGFENGTKGNWTCRMGTYGGATTAACNSTFQVTMTQNACSAGGNDGTLEPINNQANRHTIMTDKIAEDPNTFGTRITCVAPANMFPSGVNNYSFRIGNGVGDGLNGQAIAESIRYTFMVTKENAGLTYMYAAFLLEASGTNQTAHKSNEAPRFEIKITYDNNGKEDQIACGYYNVDVGQGNTNGFIKGATVLGVGVWQHTKWTKVGLDLTSYIGKNVTLEFTTADCYPGRAAPGGTNCNFDSGTHSAYAYIDLYCAPLEIISPDVCANQPSVQICGPDGYASYEWDQSGPGIQPPFNQKCVTIKNPKAGDKYTVTMTSVAGACPTKTTITLKGSDFKVENVSTCPGKSIKLTPKPTNGALTDYDWKWTPAANLSCTDCPEPTFTPGSTTTYTVTMVDKDIKNCNQEKVITVSVGTGFSVTATGGTICEGEEGTLTASGADEYTWEPGGLTGSTVTVKPTTTTVYTVTGKSTNSACPGNATAPATITVNQKPIVTVKDQTICLGESAKLSGSITGGASKGSWLGGSGTFTPDRTTIEASYKPSAAEETAGSVTLTLESDAPLAPCVKDSKTLTISIVPAVTSDAGPNQTICEGETVTLTGKFGGAATGGSWSGGTGTYAPVNTDPNAVYTPSAADISTGKVTLKFTVTNGSNSTCPGGIDEMDILIDKMPTVSAGADQTICIGESATLGGSVGGSATGGTWSGGTGTFNPNNTTLTATYTPSAAELTAGTVTLTLTTIGIGKCPVKDSKTTITINPIAVVDAGPHQKICIGGSVTLAGIVSGGAISGSWSGGTGVFSPNNGAANATYTPSKAEEAAGKVVLKYTTNDPPGPCPAVDDTMSIFIDQLPVAIAGESRSVCAGQEIKLNGKVQGAATSGTWSGGKGTFSKDNTDLTGSYTPTAQDIAAGKVTLILTTNTTGLCPADVDSVTHIIYPNPIVKFGVDVPKACPPHCVNFFDSTTAGSTNIVKWKWDFSKYGEAIVKNPVGVCFSDPGKYDIALTATSDKGCTTTLKKDYYIETYPKPVAAFTANPWSVSLYDPLFNFYDQSSTDVVSWTWNLGDGTIVSPKTINPVHKYEVGVSGKYIVKLNVVNNYGCLDSTYRTVEVLPEFTFFIPNAFTPTRDDGHNDTFFGKGVGIVEYHIWIFDRWGNLIFNTTDINTGWDGRANEGEFIAQQDVFVWKVKLKDVFGKYHDYIGTVTLVK